MKGCLTNRLCLLFLFNCSTLVFFLKKKISFVIFFNFFSIELSQSHDDLGHMYDELMYKMQPRLSLSIFSNYIISYNI
jgi:hypothetical protein